MRRGMTQHGFRSTQNWRLQPFMQSGPTLDLVFAGVATDLLGGYTLNTDFTTPQYQVAAQYTIWVSNVGLVSKTFSDIITFTRASTGTYFDSAGVLQSAAIDAPRFDYNPSTLAAQGLLIEEARTNSIRNNTMQGAVTGTPGTPPTGWFSSAPTGVTTSIVGTGTENGITYVDIRFNGTATASGAIQVGFENANQVAATVGQTFAQSLYWKLAAGSTTNLTSQRVFNNEYSSAPAYLRSNVQLTAFPTSAGLATQRVSFASTMQAATCAFVQPCLGADVANGATIDITLRIGLPQLEQGSFATSVIPTTTTALTRSADVASVNTLSPWYNATEGTLYVQAQDMSDAAHATSEPRAASINDGTANNTINIVRVPASAQARARVVTGGTPVFNTLTTAWPLATQAKIGLAYKANDFAACLGGGAVATSASGAIPTVSALTIGNITTGGSNGWVGWIQRLTYYPRRLSNAELQAITA